MYNIAGKLWLKEMTLRQLEWRP